MQRASWSDDFVHDRHVARVGGRARLIGDFRLPHWKRQANWRFEPAMSCLVRAVQQPRSSAVQNLQVCSRNRKHHKFNRPCLI